MSTELTVDEVRELAAAVVDPEIPVLTIEDLGVLRSVDRGTDGRVVVTITPTYSGCPAMDVITADIRGTLSAHGAEDVEVRTVLAPAWTTDWMSEQGKRKLVEYGIAPPGERRSSGGPVLIELAPRCPRCGSGRTRLVSRFGSTACKSIYSCQECLEPFDHFKAI
ncbi:MAG TPA: 1,2-phenylacetyl-CoA epoxidase subunit PaaD [Actinomycetes bacterium]|nr:1,2-phenylacetyl-CoA epoxidase subunit PaaD [Actinomycetes bacterium]